MIDLDAIESRANAATPKAWSQDYDSANFIWQAKADITALVAEVRTLRGAMAADDARLLAATNRLGMSPWGCDTADIMADEIEKLRRALSDRVGAVNELTRELAEARFHATGGGGGGVSGVPTEEDYGSRGERPRTPPKAPAKRLDALAWDIAKSVSTSPSEAAVRAIRRVLERSAVGDVLRAAELTCDRYKFDADDGNYKVEGVPFEALRAALADCAKRG